MITEFLEMLDQPACVKVIVCVKLNQTKFVIKTLMLHATNHLKVTEGGREGCYRHGMVRR